MPEPGKSSSRNIKVSKQAVDEAFKALSNWGRWGKDDEVGTLNYITPADVVAAAKLVKRGKVFALGMPPGENGPQRGLFGKRWDPDPHHAGDRHRRHRGTAGRPALLG